MKDKVTIYCDRFKQYVAWPNCPFNCKYFPCKQVKDKNYNTKWTEVKITGFKPIGKEKIIIISTDGQIRDEKWLTIKTIHQVKHIFKVKELKPIQEIVRRGNGHKNNSA